MGDEKVGLALVGFEFVQQIVDALGQLQHAFAAGIAVGKVGLGNFELGTVAGGALVAAEALLPQPGLRPGGDAGGRSDGFGGVGGAGEGRVQDLVDVHSAVPDMGPQCGGLFPAAGGQRAVGHAADLVFNVPDGLAVAGKIQAVHKRSFNIWSGCGVRAGRRRLR